MNNIEFPALEFDEPGVYHYVLKELTPSCDKWQTDCHEYRVVVNVTEQSGTLVACVDHPDGDPVFVNQYRDPQECKDVCIIFCECGHCVRICFCK